MKKVTKNKKQTKMAKAVKKAVKAEKKIVKKVLKARKNLTKAVSAEAKSVKFKVTKLSSDANKVVDKVKKMDTRLLVAEAVAGLTLLASLGAYSVYLVKHGNKKVDLKKLKMNVMNGMNKATNEAKKMAAKEAKKFAHKK